MPKNKQSESVKRFDFSEFFCELVRRKKIIAGIIIFCLLFSVFYSKVLCRPEYSSCAKIFIYDAKYTAQNTSELTVATYLTYDYLELVTDRTVLDEVSSDLSLDYSYGELKKMVKVNNPPDTRIIEITVTSHSPAEAQQIANKICEVSQQKIVDFMDVNRVNIFSNAYLPTSSSNAGLYTNIEYGLFASLILSVLFVIYCYYKNDKINSAEDIQKYLGLCTLGTIPFSQGKKRNPGNVKKTVRE